MSRTSRPIAAEWMVLVLIVAGAAGVRVYYVQTYASDGSRSPPVRVQDAVGPDFAEIVRNLNQGRGFPSGEISAAPLYPWLLAQLSLTPEETNVLYQRARWAQCALEALTAGLLFLCARRAFNCLRSAAGVGLIAAACPFSILSAAEINDGVLTSFLLALSLFLAVHCRFRHFGSSWLYGMLLAGLCLTRAALLPYSLVCLLWFLHRCQESRRRTVPAVLVFIGFVSGLAPWMIRNYELTNDVVPIVDSTYLHLWIGNHPGATGGPAREDPAQTDRERSGAILSTIQSDPAGTLQRRLWAGVGFVLGDDWLTKQRLYQMDDDTEPAEKILAMISIALPACLLVLIVLAGIGWRGNREWRDGSMPAALAVMVIPLPYLIGHSEALSGPRLPLDGVLICLAVYAVKTITLPSPPRV